MRARDRGKSIGALILMALAAAGETPSLKRLYDENRWFELRDAIGGQGATPLYTGALAAVFNDTKSAQKYLNRAIKTDPKAATAACDNLPHLSRS